MSPDLDGLWDEAVQKYKSTANVDLIRDLQTRTISADTILDVVKTKQGDLKAFREKRNRLWKALAPLSETLRLWAATAGHFVKLAFPPGEGIFSAIVILLEVANGMSKNYDEIADMLESLDSLISRVKLYIEDHLSDILRKMIVEALGQVLVTLGLATKVIKDGRGRTYLLKLIGKGGKVQSALDRLDEFSMQESLTATALTLSKTHRIDTTLSSIRCVLSTLQDASDKNQKESEALRSILVGIAKTAEAVSDASQTHRALLEDIRRSIPLLPEFIRDQKDYHIRSWINPQDSAASHPKILKQRTPGTGAWLMKDYRYLQFKTGQDCRSLWLNGAPGWGKSVLISTVIEDLKFKQDTEKNISVAFFYFDFRNPDKQKCRNMLASIVGQLSSSCTEARSVTEFIYSYRRIGNSRASIQDLADILHAICGAVGATYIVVDALDECTEWESLADLLSTILNWGYNSLRICVASRREIRIQNLLLPTFLDVHLESLFVNVDIAAYVDFVLLQDKRLKKWGDTERELIRKSLKFGAKGMFRWACCQMGSLMHCIHPRALRKALQSLPSSLYETYDRILIQIPDEHYEDVFNILQWLIYSKRPMKLAEIVEILAFNLEAGHFAFVVKDRPPDHQEVVDICSNLVTLSATGILELAHFTVKEYLISNLKHLANRENLKESDRYRLQRYTMDEQLAHTFIARVSLIYLNQFAEINRDTPKHYPLAMYTAANLEDHFTQARLEDLQNLIFEFVCAEDERYLNYNRLYIAAMWGDIWLNHPFTVEIIPLCRAAKAGFSRVVEGIATGVLKNCSAEDSRFNLLKSLIKATSSSNNDPTVKQLLKCIDDQDRLADQVLSSGVDSLFDGVLQKAALSKKMTVDEDTRIILLSLLETATRSNIRESLSLLAAATADIYCGKAMDGTKFVVKYYRMRTSEFKNVLYREAAVGTHLGEHRHILRFHGLLLDPERPYPGLVYKYMSMGTLDEFLKLNSDSDLFCLTCDIARGITYIHSTGVIHNDIKPVQSDPLSLIRSLTSLQGNIYIDHNYQAIIGDFGSAVFTDMKVPTKDYFPRITTRYAAPENLSFGTNEAYSVSPKVDVYSFASVVFEMVRGRHPYDHFMNETSLLARVVMDDLNPFKAHGRPNGPQAAMLTDNLWNLLLTCWNRNPDDRLDMVDILTRLENISYEECQQN